jgi:hypothetical protein
MPKKAGPDRSKKAGNGPFFCFLYPYIKTARRAAGGPLSKKQGQISGYFGMPFSG